MTTFLAFLILISIWIGFYQLVKQQGRILLRLDALERAKASARGSAEPQEHAAVEGLSLGTVFPGLELPDPSGQTHTLSEFRGRRLLLIHWNFDCGFCEAIGDDLAHLESDLELQNALIVLLASGDGSFNRDHAASHGLKSMILLLDEIESVFPEEKIQSGVKGTDGFLTVMRSVIEKGCAVVWSGYGPVLRARMDGHPIGSSLPHVPIGPLDLDECTDLIRSIGLQGSIYYEDASIESIFQYSGGVPYWTKKLCSHIFDEMEASPASPEVRVQTRDVLQAVDGLVRRDNAIRRFVSQYRRYYPHEIARVRELAQHYEVGKRFSEKDLSGSGLEAADVSNLIDYGWLRETKGEYQIAVGLFHKWFRSAGAGT